MISFECDYNNGAHPNVLKHLLETNDEQTLTYGFDKYSERAKQKIKDACENEDAQVFFLTGGTQTNATVIDSMLQQHEGVVAVDSGHISVHEAGAVEFTGHKVITLPSHNGKMDAGELTQLIDVYMHDDSREHIVYPGMVYITFPTEYGTLYSADEIDTIYKVCQKYDMPLYIDGARMGYGLMAEGTDVTLPYLAHHCDAFYIGGTKVGALCGEAVVFTHGNAHPHFFSIIKQHGALMAKGRVVGLQFDALFTDNLYFHISSHAIAMAMRMKHLFESKGYKFYIDSPTNQQFVILANDVVERLSAHVEFTHWGPFDSNHTICRFVTSWATTEEEFEELQRIIEKEG
jgi:threonine aldolase